MLKKAKADLEQDRGEPSKGLAKAVLESSHQIWLAGLGAFAKAQEGGRQVFDTLVKQGELLETKTRKAAAQTAEAARDAAAAKAKEMQTMAGGTWDKLEQVFEDRVSRSLARLGVHTSSDMEKLTARVNELSEAVNALLKSQGVKHQEKRAAGKKNTAGAVRNRAHTAATMPSTGTDTTASTVPAATTTGARARRTTGKATKTSSK